MRCLKNRRTSDLGPRREPSSASSPSRDPKLPRRDSGLLPLCPAAAAAAVAPASAKQKNGWRCSSRSVHEWCEDLHYWKLLSIIEQIIFVLIQLPSSYYSFWRAHEWIIAISVKLVVAATAAVQPAHEWWREQSSYWRAIRCLLIPNPSWFLLFLVCFSFFPLWFCESLGCVCNRLDRTAWCAACYKWCVPIL